MPAVNDFQSPANLLRNPTGYFSALVAETGYQTAELLKRISLEQEQAKLGQSPAASSTADTMDWLKPELLNDTSVSHPHYHTHEAVHFHLDAAAEQATDEIAVMPEENNHLVPDDSPASEGDARPEGEQNADNSPNSKQ